MIQANQKKMFKTYRITEKHYYGKELKVLRQHAELRGLVYDKKYYESIYVNLIGMTEDQVFKAIDEEENKERIGMEK